MSNGCIFCLMVQQQEPASVVCQDDLAMAFMDRRQFHPGHVLVIPRQHIPDVRGLDIATGSAVMAMVSRVTQAVSDTFPNQGISLWHSIGEAAFQEVPHLHIHVHPRLIGDGLLRGYPRSPDTPPKSVRDEYAEILRSRLARLPQSVFHKT